MKTKLLPPPKRNNGNLPQIKHINVLKRKRNETFCIQREVKRICARMDSEFSSAQNGTHEILLKKWKEIDRNFQSKEQVFKLNHSRELHLLDKAKEIDKQAIQAEHIQEIEKLRVDVSKKFDNKKRFNMQFRDQKKVVDSPLGFEAHGRYLLRQQVHELLGDILDDELQKKIKLPFDDVNEQLTQIYDRIQEDSNAHSKLTTARSALQVFSAIKTRDAYFRYCEQDFKVFDKVVFSRDPLQGGGTITSINNTHFLVRKGVELMMITYKDLLEARCTVQKFVEVSRTASHPEASLMKQNSVVFSPTRM